MRPALVLLALAACTDAARSVDDSEVSLQRTKFEQFSPDYRVVWHEMCGPCAADERREMNVTVAGDTITEVTYVDTGDVVPPSVRAYVLTIDQLFDKIDTVLAQDPDHFSVTYDPSFGYPRELSYGFYDVGDGGGSYALRDLRALDVP